MGISTGSGVRIAIGTQLAAENQGEFEADNYTDIGEVIEPGPFGPSRNIVEFASLQDGRVRKLRGVENLGDWTLQYANDATDEGQNEMDAAYAEQSHATDEFNFRITLNDAAGEGLDPTIIYLRAKVSSLSFQGISNDNVVTRETTLAINEFLLLHAEESTTA